MNLLVIEDDSRIAANLFDFFELRGHRCEHVRTLAEARRLLGEFDSTFAERVAYDAIILDLGLPDGDGLTLLRRLRVVAPDFPVLVLTARDTLDDKLSGFDAGADDYLVKPFALKEVEARLQALTRRAGARPQAPGCSCGPLAYDPGREEIRCRERLLQLPPKGLRLLVLLMQAPGRVFSRREIEVAVWGRQLDSSERLRSLLLTVRRELGDAAHIENRHGLGYALVV